MTLITLFITSFNINKVNPFPALTATFPLIIVSNLFTAFKAKLLANTGKLSLVKGKATFFRAFLPKSVN